MIPHEWVGVDLDGTLAYYDGWRGCSHIGLPIPVMAERVRGWLQEGRDVRIFTARVYVPQGDSVRAAEAFAARVAINTWCVNHLGKVLPITCVKDPDMIELWDDRAVQVEKNTGRQVGE